MKGDLVSTFEKNGKKLLEDLMQTEHMFLNMVRKLASMEELYYLTEM